MNGRWKKTMRVVLVLLVGVLAGAMYVLWPFHTAWAIKEAIKSGDSAYLARHVDWPPVKASLKASMADMVLGPLDASIEVEPERKSVWQRLKENYGRSVVDSLVERYANPEGLPTLFSYGRSVRKNVLMREDPDDGLSLPQRLANAYARLERATFTSPVRLELDMRDKYQPDRIYAGVLELRDWRWVMTELRVEQSTAPAPVRDEPVTQRLSDLAVTR